MPGYQRTLAVTAMLLASLLVVLVSAASAIPVQGFLAIQSGHARIGQGPLGHFVTATVAGPGFAVGFFACGEEPCLLTYTPPLSQFFGQILPPDTIFKPTTFAKNPLFPFSLFDGGTATILGVPYQHGFFFPGGHRFLPGVAPFVFDATFTTPPPFVLPGTSPGAIFTLTTPFTFSGDLVIATLTDVGLEPLLDLHLSGQGLARARLGQTCFLGEDSCTYFGLGMDFDFAPAPVPEPATLLLWGTGAAGLGLARWIRRRRSG